MEDSNIVEKCFDEGVDMGDQYRVMFHNLMEKFNQQLLRERELEKELQAEKQTSKILRERNKLYEEKFAKASQQLEKEKTNSKDLQLQNEELKTELVNANKHINELTEKLECLEGKIVEQNEEISTIKDENANFSSAFKFQESIIDKLNEEMKNMDIEQDQMKKKLKEYQEANKELELQSWKMLDSLDDIYRWVQEAKPFIVPSKSCFKKLFKRKSSNKLNLIKECLQNIENITTLFE